MGGYVLEWHIQRVIWSFFAHFEVRLKQPLLHFLFSRPSNASRQSVSCAPIMQRGDVRINEGREILTPYRFSNFALIKFCLSYTRQSKA